MSELFFKYIKKYILMSVISAGPLGLFYLFFGDNKYKAVWYVKDA